MYNSQNSFGGGGSAGGFGASMDPLGRRYSLSLSQDDILSNDQLQQIRFDPRYRDCRSISNISLSSNSNGKSRNNSNNSLSSINSGQMFGGRVTASGPAMPSKRWDTNPSIYIEEYVDDSDDKQSGSCSLNSSAEQIVQPLDEYGIKSVSSVEEIPFIDDSEKEATAAATAAQSVGIMIDKQRRESTSTTCRKTVSFDMLNESDNNNDAESKLAAVLNCSSCETNVMGVKSRKLTDTTMPAIIVSTEDSTPFIETTTEIQQGDQRVIFTRKISHGTDLDLRIDKTRYNRGQRSKSSPDISCCDRNFCGCLHKLNSMTADHDPTPDQPENDIVCHAHSNLCCFCSDLNIDDPATNYKDCKNLEEIYDKMDKIKQRIKNGGSSLSKSLPIVNLDLEPAGLTKDLNRPPDGFLLCKTKQCRPDCKSWNLDNITISEVAYKVQGIQTDPPQQPTASTSKTIEVDRVCSVSGGTKEVIKISTMTSIATSTTGSGGTAMATTQSGSPKVVKPKAKFKPAPMVTMQEVLSGKTKKRKSLSEKIAEVLRRGRYSKKERLKDNR